MSGSSPSFLAAFTAIITWLLCETVTAISWRSLILIGYIVLPSAVSIERKMFDNIHLNTNNWHRFILFPDY
jgi:hypothetical protein